MHISNHEHRPAQRLAEAAECFHDGLFLSRLRKDWKVPALAGSLAVAAIATAASASLVVLLADSGRKYVNRTPNLTMED